MVGVHSGPEPSARSGTARWARRGVLGEALLFAGGAALGAAITDGDALSSSQRKLPDGPVSATLGSGRQDVGRGGIGVAWAGDPTARQVALTFDDGPGPLWTPKVLDTLDRYAVPATFFLVGERTRRHADLLRGRLDRHEVGNHSWAHTDLARLDARAAHDDLRRTHDVVTEVTGVAPRLLRPPYGHLGGAVLHAAVRLDYRLVFWTLQMREREFPADPAGHARRIVADVRPGTILLAHDVGKPRRRVALDGLPAMISGLRERGFEFVTVSQILQNTGSVGRAE